MGMKRSRRREVELPNRTDTGLRAQMEETAEMLDNASRAFEQCIVDSEKLKLKMAKTSHSCSKVRV
jgi:hypothetical protein